MTFPTGSNVLFTATNDVNLSFTTDTLRKRSITTTAYADSAEFGDTLGERDKAEDLAKGVSLESAIQCRHYNNLTCIGIAFTELGNVIKELRLVNANHLIRINQGLRDLIECFYWMCVSRYHIMRAEVGCIVAIVSRVFQNDTTLSSSRVATYTPQ